jgi:hypothetical protein
VERSVRDDRLLGRVDGGRRADRLRGCETSGFLDRVGRE